MEITNFNFRIGFIVFFMLVKKILNFICCGFNVLKLTGFQQNIIHVHFGIIVFIPLPGFQLRYLNVAANKVLEFINDQGLALLFLKGFRRKFCAA